MRRGFSPLYPDRKTYHHTRGETIRHARRTLTDRIAAYLGGRHCHHHVIDKPTRRIENVVTIADEEKF